MQPIIPILDRPEALPADLKEDRGPVPTAGHGPDDHGVVEPTPEIVIGNSPPHTKAGTGSDTSNKPSPPLKEAATGSDTLPTTGGLPAPGRLMGC